VKVQPPAPIYIGKAFALRFKREFGWLDDKVNALRSFRGSLLGYVGSSPRVEGVNVLRLDANENFFADPAFLRDVFYEAVGETDLRLYDPEVMARLKESLGGYVGVSPECVGVGSGSEDLIDFLVQFFLGAGEEAISVVPSFLWCSYLSQRVTGFPSIQRVQHHKSFTIAHD
jgi:histidinol-phosphate/aromatic aminotransferase/cobyric acid decarboxylase-like protein